MQLSKGCSYVQELLISRMEEVWLEGHKVVRGSKRQMGGWMVRWSVNNGDFMLRAMRALKEIRVIEKV